MKWSLKSMLVRADIKKCKFRDYTFLMDLSGLANIGKNA